ncbi:MAG: Flp family type IVb pilin [Bdellovibrionales bacterium]
MNRIRNPRGQGLVEYVILVALVGVATIVLVRKLQGTINVNMANIIHALQSDSQRKSSFDRLSEEDVKTKDFSNFMNGTTDRTTDRSGGN